MPGGGRYTVVSAHSKKPRRRSFEMQLDRHEAKYIIHPSLVPRIREYIRPFCEPDPNGKGEPPEYVITTLQLDSPNLALHHAKENEARNRFKLRARTYGKPGDSPVFAEVKQKNNGIIYKSRAAIPFDKWNESLVYDKHLDLRFKTPRQETSFLTFLRLVREIGARPVTLIRYTRESYFGRIDHYARVTFDRNLLCQPTESWDSWGRGGRWINIDSTLAQNKSLSYSGVVLELKTLSDAPLWMVDLVMEFGLERTGNCKYSTAVWLESIVRGTPNAPQYATGLLSF